MIVAYYSPTGNTKLLATDIHNILGGTLIDMAKPTEKVETTITKLIILFPIHAFSAPKLVLQYIKNLPVDSTSTVGVLAVGCATAAINNGATYKVKKILQKKGATIVLEEVLQMPLTLVLKVADEKNKEIVSQTREQVSQLITVFQEAKPVHKKTKLTARIFSSIGNVEKLAARLFGLELHASNKCTSCGICWNNCPVDNITKSNKGKPSFGFSCTMCLRCIYSCPEGAIKPIFSRFIPIKGGYDITDYLENTIHEKEVE